MQIDKPKYLINDFMDSFEDKEYKSNIEKEITFCILNILDESIKYIMNDLIELYVDELKSVYSVDDLSSVDHIDNISIEFFDNFNNKDVLISIVDSENDLVKKLFMLLGKNLNKKLKIMIYYHKDDDDKWCIPIQAVCFDGDFNKYVYDIYPNKTYEYKNSSLFRDESTKSVLGSLFDLFSNILNIFSYTKMEHVLFQSSESKTKGKKKKRPKYYYKVLHLFFRKPEKVTNKKLSDYSSLKRKNNHFYKNIKKIESGFYYK